MKILLIRNEKLRKALGILIPFVFIPALVILFSFGPGRKHYALSSLIITLAAIVVFSCGFERRKTGTRRLIVVAVMTALSVIGRFIFTAIPAFKPITAVVVITAVYLGGEAGFLTGALSALISNFYFGQGPWTPFQMLSWGLIGLLAGFLSMPMKKSRIVLSLYAVFAGAVYSFIMDTTLLCKNATELFFFGIGFFAFCFGVLFSLYSVNINVNGCVFKTCIRFNCIFYCLLKIFCNVIYFYAEFNGYMHINNGTVIGSFNFYTLGTCFFAEKFTPRRGSSQACHTFNLACGKCTYSDNNIFRYFNISVFCSNKFICHNINLQS